MKELTGPDRDEALGFLNERETASLEYMLTSREKGGGYFPISTDMADRMFQLFLRGLSCEDIRVLNPGFQLAQIVEARVNGRWDNRKQNYDLQLVTDGADAIRRSQMEAALLAADLITASAHLNRQKIQKYLQSGDESHIKDVDVGSLKQLHQALEVLMKATRQDQPAQTFLPERQESRQSPAATTVIATPTLGVKELAAAKKAERTVRRKPDAG